MYELSLTKEHMQTLAGALDVFVKTVGARALGPDVVSLVRAIEAAQVTEMQTAPIDARSQEIPPALRPGEDAEASREYPHLAEMGRKA
jgi:hypothetical protein